jgi:hypothetical protein
MRVISAYLLAVLGGNAAPSAADINKILGAGEDPLRFAHLVVCMK